MCVCTYIYQYNIRWTIPCMIQSVSNTLRFPLVLVWHMYVYLHARTCLFVNLYMMCVCTYIYTHTNIYARIQMTRNHMIQASERSMTAFPTSRCSLKHLTVDYNSFQYTFKDNNVRRLEEFLKIYLIDINCACFKNSGSMKWVYLGMNCCLFRIPR